MSKMTYTQPELPLAEAALAEHIEKSGHAPLKTTDGWVCLADDDCYAAWPPLTEHQIQMERVQKELFRTGKAIIEIPGGTATIVLGYN